MQVSNEYQIQPLNAEIFLNFQIFFEFSKFKKHNKFPTNVIVL